MANQSEGFVRCCNCKRLLNAKDSSKAGRIHWVAIARKYNITYPYTTEFHQVPYCDACLKAEVIRTNAPSKSVKKKKLNINHFGWSFGRVAISEKEEHHGEHFLKAKDFTGIQVHESINTAKEIITIWYNDRENVDVSRTFVEAVWTNGGQDLYVDTRINDYKIVFRKNNRVFEKV